MKKILMGLILSILICIASGLKAATLENLDLEVYKIEMRLSYDTVIHQTLYEQATLYGICEFGCLLVLMDTGQTIEVNPEDTIVVEDGVLKRKK